MSRGAVSAAVCALVLLAGVTPASADATLIPSALPDLLAAERVELVGGVAAASAVEVVDYTDDYPLYDSSIERLVGKRTKRGCEFGFPELSLGPDESAVEARVISTDFETCVQLIEVGRPPLDQLSTSPQNGASSIDRFGAEGVAVFSEPFASASSVAVSAAASTATAYYEVRWHDVLHLTTHYTRAYTTWSWNGSCVTSSSSWGFYWWLQLTSWTNVANRGFYSQTCNNVKSTVDWAHYRNTLFCYHPSFGYTIVNSYVDDAWVRGYYNGSVNGNVSSTWTAESGVLPELCPNLHYHVVTVKT